MESPVCFIENIDGTLKVVPQAVTYLMGISQPVVVVAVVGLYRTGKSYLMNKLAGKSKGFALGATIQSKTKGIWMWCLPHPVSKDHTLVLLDTEGLGDVEKGDQKNDAWIFSLAILLSSTLVYNSRGTIDNQAVENLQYVTELTEQIKVKAPTGASSSEDGDDEGGDAEFVQFFPNFVWAVRDFTLLLEINGRNVDDDEYLDHALSLKEGRDRKTVDYNLPRECIRNYFPTRKCFVFETPAAPEKMTSLESLQENELSAAFKAVTVDFCKYIYQKSAVKKLKGGSPVTGRMLGHLAQTYVQTIASGGVPCLENAVVAMAQIENQAAVQEGLQLYRKGMREVTFPVDMEEMSKHHRHWDSLATEAFMQRSFKDENGEYLKALTEGINEQYAALLLENEGTSEKFCKQLLSDLSAEMAKKLESGFYAKPGGYDLYCTDHNALLAKYQGAPNKGVKAEEVLEGFLKEKSVESNSILQADKNLSEKDREIHEETQRSAVLEQEAKRATKECEIAEQKLEDQKVQLEERIHNLKEKLEREAALAHKEMELALQSKLQEQEKLMAKGFKEKEAIMATEIEKLQEEMEEAKNREKMEKMEVIKSVTSAISGGVNSYLEYQTARKQYKIAKKQDQMSKRQILQQGRMGANLPRQNIPHDFQLRSSPSKKGSSAHKVSAQGNSKPNLQSQGSHKPSQAQNSPKSASESQANKEKENGTSV